MKVLWIQFILILSWNLEAWPSSDTHCRSNDIVRIQVPIFPNQANSPVMSYAFKLFRASDPKATTIVVLPGGPGGTLLGHSPKHPYATGAIPFQDFNIVYIDPRGSGCNDNDTLPNQAFKSNFSASDIVSVISKLQLKNYIIYGVSFGTVLATQVSYMIENSALPKPKAIVLEGIFGRAIPNRFQDYAKIFSHQWKRIQHEIDPVVIEKLNQPTLPLGFSSLSYGFLFFNNLTSGHVPGKGSLLSLDLNALSSNDPTSINRLKQKLSQFPFHEVPLQSRLFQTIGCQELFSSWGHLRFTQGDLVPIEHPEICRGFAHKPYDSGDWQISTPIYYFQGPHDPATPWDSARYHYTKQIKAKRTFVTVAEAAHAPLTGSMKILNCHQKVWWAIDRSPGQFEAVLRSCLWPIAMEQLNPN